MGRTTSSEVPTIEPPLHEEASAPDTAPEFALPSELAGSEDLTERVRAAAGSLPYPFEADPQSERLFDALARVLHQGPANHILLTGERGVGKSTIVIELARRAATGRIPFLRQRRVLRVDCRFFAPDESRLRLAALLSLIADRPELIVCVDGFAALLRGERAAGNKATLLSGLARAGCQLIGLVTPREYDDLVADDPDYQEFFTRVDVVRKGKELAKTPHRAKYRWLGTVGGP